MNDGVIMSKPFYHTGDGSLCEPIDAHYYFMYNHFGQGKRIRGGLRLLEYQ